MRNLIKRTILCCLASFASFFLSCAFDMGSLKVEKSLPAEKLARYNDSFDSLRDDIWGKIGYIRNVYRKTNFKWADVRVESGQLKVETKTGSFSQGGIQSHFYFRGDFDIQVDCAVYFLKDNDEIDQGVRLIGADKTADLENDAVENIILELSKRGKNPVFIVGGYHEKGKWNRRHLKEIGNFYQGTLRIVRIGRQVTLLYKSTGEMEWQKACSFFRPSYDTTVTLKVQNFIGDTIITEAKATFSAQFDNFRVNAAQEIIEDEI